jgi:hypothetical protein
MIKIINLPYLDENFPITLPLENRTDVAWTKFCVLRCDVLICTRGNIMIIYNDRIMIKEYGI